MLLSGGHAAQNEKELRGFRWLWSGVRPAQQIGDVPTRELFTRQEMPVHPGSRVFAGVTWAPSSAIAFRSHEFHAPYSSLGLRLRGNNNATLLAGRKGYLVVPFDCSIVKVSLLASSAGSVVVDIYRLPLPQLLAGTQPGPSNTLIGLAADRPALNNAQNALDFTLYSWSTALKRNDALCFDVLSNSGISSLTLTLLVARNDQP